MPLSIENSDLHERIHKRDHSVLKKEEADQREYRELHLCIVNMMPAGALKPTELDFLLPIGQASGALQIVPHFVRIEGVDYGKHHDYVIENYNSFDEMKEIAPDAMIVTGANLPSGSPTEPPFYNPMDKGSQLYQALEEIIKYAESDDGPTSTLYSCLASHAYMQIKHNAPRQKMQEKRWGNFEHQNTSITHPMTEGISSHFMLPHSRWNQITWEQVLDAEMKLLAYSDEAGVLLASSKDGIRAILMQGHPEYSTTALLKEWNRDLGQAMKSRISGDDISAPIPPLPANYFEGHSLTLAKKFQDQVFSGEFDEQIKQSRLIMPKHIEKQILDAVPNRHSSISNDILGKWISSVHNITHYDRGKPFMENLDPDNPLNLPQDEPIYSPVYFPE